MLHAKVLTLSIRGGAVAVLGLLALGCPQGESGECNVDEDCRGRAQVCDSINAICVDKEIDLDSTELPADDSTTKTFSDKAIPFFRGQVCTTHEVQSGERIPVSVNPCLHPCIRRGSHHFKHFFNCTGSTCDGYVVMWVKGSSIDEGCPTDVFGRFDESLCVYGEPVELGIRTQLDSGPISGTMDLEAPFLSNADIEKIDGGRDTNAEMRTFIEQYPQDPARVVGNRAISILPNHPVPPDACGDDQCTCYSIGF